MKTVRAARSLLLGSFLVLTGVGLLNTLLAFRLERAGLSAAGIGWVQAAYFLGLVGGARHGHRVVRRVGHSRAYAAFAGVITAAALGHGLVDAPAAWVALRFATGFNVAGIYLVTESWLNELADDRKRGRLLALYTVVSQLGVANGQLVFGLGDPGRAEGFAIAGMAFSLALVPVALSRTRAPELVDVSSLRLRALVRATPVGVMGCVLSGVLIGALYGVGPVFASRLGLDAKQLARFMGLLVLGGVIAPSPIGWLADRYDRTLVIVGVAVALSAVSAVLASPLLPGFVPLATLGFVLGGLVFVVYPLAVAQANDYVAPHDRLAATGALLLAYGLGSALGPALGGNAITALGPRGIFVLTGIAAGAFAAFALARRALRPPLAAAEQAPFVSVPRTTVVAAQLDPRVELDAPAAPQGR